MGILLDRHNLGVENKRQIRDMYQEAITRGLTDPQHALSEEQLSHAADQYARLLEPDAKKTFQGVLPFLGHLMGFSRNAKYQPPSAPVKAPVNPADVQQGAQGPVSREPQTRMSIMDTFQQGASPYESPDSKRQAAFNAVPTKAQQLAQAIQSVYPSYEQSYARSQGAAQQERDRRYKAGKDIGLTGRDLAEFQETGRLPAIGSAGTFATVWFKDPQGKMHAVRRNNRTNEITDRSGADFQVPDDWEEVINRGPINQEKMWYRLPGETMDDPPHMGAVDRVDRGLRFDEKGEPLAADAHIIEPTREAAELRANAFNEGFKLAANYRVAFRQQYPQLTPAQINDLAARAGAKDYISRYNKQTAYIGAGHETLGEDALHNSIAIALQRIPTPNQGIPPAPGAPPPAAAPLQAPVAAPAQTPAAPAVAPAAPPARGPRTPATQGNNLPPGARLLPGTSPANARLAWTLSVPITGLVTQTWGDPKDPSFKGLAAYGKLADNQAAKERIGKAIQFTLNGVGSNLDSAAVGAGTGPVHVTSGGFGTWLQNFMGIPGAIAAQDAAKLRNALDDMKGHPEELEAYYATMAQLSMLAGARAMNRGGAALGFLDKIEREFPKIGVNSQSSAGFNYQLNRTAKEVENFLENGPFPRVRGANGSQQTVGVAPEMLEFVHRTAAGSVPAPAPGGKQNAPAYKKGDKVMYQGKEHTVQDVVNGKLVLSP